MFLPGGNKSPSPTLQQPDRHSLLFTTAAVSLKGSGPRHEDASCCGPHFCAVFDGVSGSKHKDHGGRLAARLAADTAEFHLAAIKGSDNPEMDEVAWGEIEIHQRAIARCFKGACAAIAGQQPFPGGINPATTAALTTVLSDGRAVVAWAGDSRVYHYTDGSYSCVTTDHDGYQRPRRGLHAGAAGYADADLYEINSVDMKPGDILICMSDGVFKTPRYMEEVARHTEAFLRRYGDHKPRSDQLEELAYSLCSGAVRAGADDNVSVALLHACDRPRFPSWPFVTWATRRSRLTMRQKVGAGLVAISALLGILIATKSFSRHPSTNTPHKRPDFQPARKTDVSYPLLPSGGSRLPYSSLTEPTGVGTDTDWLDQEIFSLLLQRTGDIREGSNLTFLPAPDEPSKVPLIDRAPEGSWR